MAKLIAFADDDASVAIGELTVENGTDVIALYGSLDITRDKRGLAYARALQALLAQAIGILEADKRLPDALPPPAPAKTVPNPFS